MSSFIARILAGEQLCPGEIPHHNGHMILAHLQEHEDGRCRRTGSGGHFHPMSDPDVDGPHARRLLAEAADACTCDDRKHAP